MRIVILIFSTLLFLTASGQNKSVQTKNLTDRISSGGIINISIEHGAERFQRYESLLIYHADSFLRVHCVMTTNSNKKNIDTAFNLSPQQCDIINRFGEAVDSNNIPSRLVIAGTYSKYFITVKGQSNTISDKSNYSLVSELLGLDY